ncbi:MAG: Dna2/Cas4 domain-containing protein [Acidobacteriota bacterium]
MKLDATAYSAKALENVNATLCNAVLNWEDLTAKTDFLIRKENNQHKRRRYYEPAIVVGNYTITKEQILHITFAGYVLSKVQGQKIASGTVITADNKSHRVKLETASKTIEPILAELRKWKLSAQEQPPPVILNKHCSYCQFKEECYAKAKEIDHLSLLQGISKKEIEHQNKKGIFQ